MVDWYSVLSEYGVSLPDDNQVIIHCPFHEDSRQSCSINLEKGVWICFAGCGQGSLKYFIYKLSGKSWNEVDSEIEEKNWELDLSLFDEPVLDDFIDTTPQYEPPDELVDIADSHWIYKRGFTKETIRKWGCKTNRYLDLLIPVENTNSEVQGWVSRRTQAIPKYLFSAGFAKSHSLFGINQLYQTETIYVVEGALDCMWLNQHGYSAVAILGASVSPTQIDLISTLHPDEVVLALDNDEAGKKGMDKASIDMGDRFMLSYLKLPKQYKDVQEINNISVLNKVINNKSIW